MSTIHIYSDKEGKLKWIKDLPEEPKESDYYGGAHCEGFWDDHNRYQDELHQAKDNAIPIGNEEEVKGWIKDSEYSGYKSCCRNKQECCCPKPDTIYSIEGYEVEVDARHHPTLAYIKPIQHPENKALNQAYNLVKDTSYTPKSIREKEEKETQGELSKIRDLCVKFFYWWYNEKGNNTEQGFNKWAKTTEGANLINTVITRK
jgi:hypothetical protein